MAPWPYTSDSVIIESRSYLADLVSLAPWSYTADSVSIESRSYLADFVSLVPWPYPTLLALSHGPTLLTLGALYRDPKLLALLVFPHDPYLADVLSVASQPCIPDLVTFGSSLYNADIVSFESWLYIADALRFALWPSLPFTADPVSTASWSYTADVKFCNMTCCSVGKFWIMTYIADCEFLSRPYIADPVRSVVWSYIAYFENFVSWLYGYLSWQHYHDLHLWPSLRPYTSDPASPTSCPTLLTFWALHYDPEWLITPFVGLKHSCIFFPGRFTHCLGSIFLASIFDLKSQYYSVVYIKTNKQNTADCYFSGHNVLKYALKYRSNNSKTKNLVICMLNHFDDHWTIY